MALSNTKRGNYYKTKSKKWLENHGYTVEITEFMSAVFIAPGKVMYKKKDILASDGVAYNEEEFILWNSKVGGSAANRSERKSQGKKEYLKIIVPKFIKKWLIIWEPKVRDPQVIHIDE